MQMKAMLDKTLSSRKAQEQKVMDFLRANENSVPSLSISEIAQGAGVSSPTVVRFCKSLGYDGFKDFKINFQNEARRARRIDEPITWDSSDDEIRTSMSEKSVFSVQSLFTEQNMQAITKMVDAIVSAHDTDIIGMGGSAIVAEYLFKDLLRYGKKVSLFSDPYMTRHNTVGRSDGEVFIAISCSGSNSYVLSAAEDARRNGKRLFAITNNPDSPLALMSEAVVQSCTVTGFKDEGNSFSRLSQFAAVNMITLMTALRLGKEDSEYRSSFKESSNYQNFISGDKDVH